MRQLLDTHIFLWFVMGSPKITEVLRGQIEDNENFLSILSVWEIAIKYGIGKLNLGVAFDDFIEEQITSNGIQLLNINLEHLKVFTSLPFHHRDPFDRLLIAQAMVEDVAIVSADSAFSLYSVQIICS